MRTNPFCHRGHRLIACLLIVGAHLSAPPHVHALIQKLFSIKDIMNESQVIAEGKIERVDGKEQTVVIRVTGDIKGRCADREIKILVAFGEPWHPAIMMKRLKPDAPVILFQKPGETFVYRDRKEHDEVHCIGYTGGVWFLATGNRREQLEQVRWALGHNQLRSARAVGADAPDLNRQLDDFEQSGERVFWIFRHVELYLTRTFRGSTQELIDLVKDIHKGKSQAPPPDPSVPPLSLDSLKKEESAGQPQLPGVSPSLTVAANSDWAEGYEAYSRWSVQGWGGPAELATPFSIARGRVLRVDYPGAKHEKIAVGRTLVADLSGARRLVFEAINASDAPVKLAWAFKTDALKQYFECPPVELAPGSWKYDLETDLTASHFKCAAADWQYRSRLIAPERVVELILLIYDAPASMPVPRGDTLIGPPDAGAFAAFTSGGTSFSASAAFADAVRSVFRAGADFLIVRATSMTAAARSGEASAEASHRRCSTCENSAARDRSSTPARKSGPAIPSSFDTCHPRP